jgi:tetratricopeptide (TPR) repeat protein
MANKLVRIRSALVVALSGAAIILPQPAESQPPATDPEVACGIAASSTPQQIIAACNAKLASGVFDPSRNEPFSLYVLRGAANRLTNNLQTALADANQAISLQPNSPFGYILRGRTHNSLGQSAAALADFDTALGIQPSNTFALDGRISALLRLKRYPEAGQAAGRLVQLQPGGASANNLACWVNGAFLNLNLDRAREHCDTALRVAPNTPAYLDSRGMVALKQGRFDDAWRDYDTAARLAPDNAGHIFGRGIAALRLGRSAPGEADLAAARRLDPSIEQTYSEYGINPTTSAFSTPTGSSSRIPARPAQVNGTGATALPGSQAPSTVGSRSGAQAPLAPVLSFLQPSTYRASDQTLVRYPFVVSNRASFPAELFVASPGLPPCGRNVRSSRTWVDIYEEGGRRLYGFCALDSTDDLASLWFALPEGAPPVSSIYILMIDRLTGTRYRSAATAVPPLRPQSSSVARVPVQSAPQSPPTRPTVVAASPPQRAAPVTQPAEPPASLSVDPSRFLTEVCAPYVLQDRTPGGWSAAVGRATRQGFRVDSRDGTYAVLKRGEHEITLQYFTEFQQYDQRTIVITKCRLTIDAMTEAQTAQALAPAMRTLNIRNRGDDGWSVSNLGRQFSFDIDSSDGAGVYLGGAGAGVYIPADGSVAASVELRYSNKFFN